ncbi:MAG: GTP-binding protein [Acidobacteriota bacterium]
MMTTRLVLVGGFLGAGKTTLLREAAKRLAERGLRAGLITNDQAPELVDTRFLSRNGLRVAEVSGSCFCCNYQGLIDAMSRVRAESEADVLLAEPVGSCTDLSATIVQPLKDQLGRELVTAPLSVLVDPARLADILDGGTAGLHPSAAYIFLKQMEEADVLVVSKTDLLSAEDQEALRERLARRFPEATVCELSARNGDGLDAWLDVVMTRSDAGRLIPEVDYDVYAEGEAVLGWLNATLELRGEPTDWTGLAEEILREMGRRCDSLEVPIGHVKLLIETGDGFLAGNLTGLTTYRDDFGIRGSAGRSSEARLTLNARVQMTPEALEDMVREVLASACRGRITATPVAWRCLSPGRPTPTHRYDRVVTLKGR